MGLQNMGFQQCAGIQNVRVFKMYGYSILWVLNFVRIQNVWVFKFWGYSKSMKTSNFVGKQNLWVVKMGVFNIMWGSKICGYSLLWVFKCICIYWVVKNKGTQQCVDKQFYGYLHFVGIQNILVCIFAGTQKLMGNENVWVCVSKLCG